MSHYYQLLPIYYPLLSMRSIDTHYYQLSSVIHYYPWLSIITHEYQFIIHDYQLLSIVIHHYQLSSVFHYYPLWSIIIMTPCRTEKAGFSKKIKNTIKSRITKKTTQQEELPEKQKNKKKTKITKKNKTCIFLRFLSVFSCFSCWRVVVFAFSCFFLDFGFLVCFFCSLWFCFFWLFFVKPYILWVAGLMTLLSIINDYPWWLSMMITHFIIHYYPLLSNIINYYPLLLIGYTAFLTNAIGHPSSFATRSAATAGCAAPQAARMSSTSSQQRWIWKLHRPLTYIKNMSLYVCLM